MSQGTTIRRSCLTNLMHQGVATMTISLPSRCLLCLATLLSEIPPTQSRLSLDKWHSLLGELRSMSLALPGA